MYRNDKDANEMRRQQLANELSKLNGSLSDTKELARRKQSVQRDIRRLNKQVAKAQRKMRLPLLENVQVAAPCNERWNAMEGDDTVRHCGACDNTVFDLSSLSATEAEALLKSNKIDLCVRFYRRKDGTVMTTDCLPGVIGHKGRKRFAFAASLGVGMAAVVGVALHYAGLSWTTPTLRYVPSEPVMPSVRQVMGAYARPQEPIDPCQADPQPTMGDPRPVSRFDFTDE